MILFVSRFYFIHYLYYMKLAIITPHLFTDYNYLIYEIKHYYLLDEIDEIVSIQNDLVEKFANEFNIKITIFKSNWTKYGRSANLIKTQEIIDYCDELLVFVDNDKNLFIDLASDSDIPFIIIQIN